MFFAPPTGVMDICTFGSWMSTPICLLLQSFGSLPEDFDPWCPPEWPAGYLSRKLSLWGMFLVPDLSGVFRHSASLAMPHRKKFRCDTIRLPSAPWAHESQCFGVTRIAAWYCPRSALSTLIPNYPQGEVGDRHRPWFRRVCVFWRFVGRWHRTIRIRIRTAAESQHTMPPSSW